MTPINEVPVGKFCRFAGNVVYIYKNNFKDFYGVIPVVGVVPRYKKFGYSVYVYKRIKNEWIKAARKHIDRIYKTPDHILMNNGVVVESEVRLDNLTYIENIDILKSYGI